MAVSGGVAVALVALLWIITSLVSYFDREQKLAGATRELEEIVKRAEAKDPLAEYDLAVKYRVGDGVRMDRREAAIWLERAAEHGHAPAQFEWGMASLKGDGVLQDFAAALKWLSRAAESGNAEARYNLGLLYRNGTGVAPDDFKAYIWLNLAAAQGVDAAIAPRQAAMKVLSPDQVLKAQAEAALLRDTARRVRESGAESAVAPRINSYAAQPSSLRD